jgi:hypothetical protein
MDAINPGENTPLCCWAISSANFRERENRMRIGNTKREEKLTNPECSRILHTDHRPPSLHRFCHVLSDLGMRKNCNKSYISSIGVNGTIGSANGIKTIPASSRHQPGVGEQRSPATAAAVACNLAYNHIHGIYERYKTWKKYRRKLDKEWKKNCTVTHPVSHCEPPIHFLSQYI